MNSNLVKKQISSSTKIKHDFSTGIFGGIEIVADEPPKSIIGMLCALIICRRNDFDFIFSSHASPQGHW